ncbi:glycosyltransferase family 1 protein [Pleomorphomonas sp. NRK KF1]|uniref:glycosyltransferase family 4 protein n=1 Tax=Pleomorphomonas sp. NRK KF1 TaxID=2943000 RepID=UPI002042E42B|nr:glycosyltransferase family 1 protein [Pleomorphomonas sp. NRK KF1]MCM5555605.1 glycosyltransferase family 1 protein [Pleomorphomonas sp. NRK KF1]
MRVLIATDAWHPQVNGVVRTLDSVSKVARNRGIIIKIVPPNDFVTIPAPTYPEIRLAIPRIHRIKSIIDEFKPDSIHITTEGPVGYAFSFVCRKRCIPFTTSFTTKFPEYIEKRFRLPKSWSYRILRRFHAAADRTMVATPSLIAELKQYGFESLVAWGRGVDTELFTNESPITLGYKRPIFVSMGRVAIEKNLEAFLSLELPGTKVVIGKGPDEQRLKEKYREAVFLGEKTGRDLARHLAAADVFVFPSTTDTFGNSQLEALACGVPVAAYPVTGPIDVIGNAPVGVLSANLKQACIEALSINRQKCREYALERTWDVSCDQFLSNLSRIFY